MGLLESAKPLSESYRSKEVEKVVVEERITGEYPRVLEVGVPKKKEEDFEGLHALEVVPELVEEYKKAKEQYGPALHKIEGRLKDVWHRLTKKDIPEKMKFHVSGVSHERPLTEFVKPRAAILKHLEDAEIHLERARKSLTEVI